MDAHAHLSAHTDSLRARPSELQAVSARRHGPVALGLDPVQRPDSNPADAQPGSAMRLPRPVAPEPQGNARRETTDQGARACSDVANTLRSVPRTTSHRSSHGDPCDQCFQSRSCLQAAMLREGSMDRRGVASAAIRLDKGQRLFTTGRALDRVYAVRAGSFKSVLRCADGRQQVLGFHIFGDMMGLDGFAAQLYLCDAVAMEASEACEIDARALESAARDHSMLRRRIQSLIAQSLLRTQHNLLVLGSMQGAERLAQFLWDLSERYQALGLSSREFALRMTRKDIGSYLGLYSETVSRLFTRLEHAGLIQMARRHRIRILDRIGLAALLSSSLRH